MSDYEEDSIAIQKLSKTLTAESLVGAFRAESIGINEQLPMDVL